MKRPLSSLILFIVAVTAPAHGQSLAEVARKEEQRRQEVGKPSPVYTNKNLQPARPGGSVTADPAAPAAGTANGDAEGAKTVADPSPGTGTASAGGPGGDEGPPKAYTEDQWRTRMAEARTELERSRMFADALQSRINALTADFTARDDPAQRAAIAAERQRALAEFGRVKDEIQARITALADLEEEARKARVPPGWLR
jgi:hypothetical protein